MTGWREIFSDGYSTWDPSRYNVYPTPWKDSSKNGTYGYPGGISSDGSKLRVRLYTENGIIKVQSFSPKFQLPGLVANQMESARIEFRLRADVMRGFKMAPLLWPLSEVWPRDGEIDFPEGDFTGGTVSAFMHRQGGTWGGDQDAYSTTAKHVDWHTYRIEWIDGVSAQFFVDGVSIGKSTSRVPNTPMRWQFQFETSLSGIIPDPATSGYVEIDYFKIWVPA